MASVFRTTVRHRGTLLLVALTLALPTAAHAAELVIRVTGLENPLGNVGCSLFAGPLGFPMDNAKEVVIDIKETK